MAFFSLFFVADKNQPITLYICHACGERFFSLVEIEDHKVNNHPNVICTHLEVEGMKNVPSELFPSHCSLVGALQRCAAPPSVGVDTTILLQCTKCHEAFQKSADLHEHILQCGGHSETVACERYPKRGRPLRRSRRMVLRGMKRELDDEPVKARKTFVQKNKKIKKDEYSWLQNCERPTADRYQTLESETDLMCDGCNRKFKYSSGLERHQKSCLVSESASARVDALKDVRRQHSCKYCLRSFTYMASLKKHMSDFCASKTAQSAKLPSVPSKSMQTILAKKKLRAKKKSRKLRFRFVAKKAVASLAVPVDEESVKTTVGGSSSTMASESNSNSQDVAVAAEVCVNDPSGSTDENVTVDKSDVAPVTSMKQEISTVTVLEDEEQLVTVEVKREKEEDVNKIEDEDEAGEEEEEEENDDEDVSQSKEDEEKLSAMQETGQAVAKASLATEVIAKGTHEVAEPKKEGSIKIESDCGSLNVRREQMHTCPNCKRTFTYLANFKKHLNDLCPLRTMETKDNPDSTQKSGIDPREKAGGTGTSAQEAEDQEGVGLVAATPAAPDRPSDIGNEMTGSYVTMLKHRLSHKLKTSNSDNGGATSSDSGKGEPSTPDTSGTNFCGATTRATSCIVTRSSERKRQMTWWRGRKRATTGAYSRKADAGTSSPAIKQRVSPRRGASVTDKAAVSEETEEEGDGGSSGDGGEDDDGDQERENEVDNGHSPRESKAALNRNRAKTVKNNNNNNPESSKTTTLSSSASITDTGSTIQKGFISQCRRMILRKVKESNPCPKSDDDDSLNNTAKEDG